MTDIAQRSFSSGEISPSLYQRVDTAQYQAGLKTAKNTIILKHGGITGRPGTKHVAEAKLDSESTLRVVPYAGSAQDSYLLVFGDGYMFVVKNGDYVYEATMPIESTLSRANPDALLNFAYTPPIGGVNAVIRTSDSTGDKYTNNGMSHLINRDLLIAEVESATTRKVKTKDGTVLSLADVPAQSLGGHTMIVKKVYFLETGITKASGALDEFMWSRGTDGLIITHNSFQPKRIYPLSESNWVVTDVSFSPVLTGANAASVDPTTATTTNVNIVGGTALTITFATSTSSQGTIAVSTAHSYAVGDIVYLPSFPGGYAGPNASNQYFTVTAINSATAFVVSKSPSSAWVGITTRGTSTKVMVGATTTSGPTSGQIVNRYKITSINKDTFEESLPYETPIGMTSFSNPSLGIVTFTTSGNHKLYPGDQILISEITSTVEDSQYVALNNNYYLVKTTPTATTFTIETNPIYSNPSGITNYGKITKDFFVVGTSAEISVSNKLTLTWPIVQGAIEYNIYRALNGFFGKIGVAMGNSFVDAGSIPDLTDAPPIKFFGFQTEGNYPSVSGFIRQRRAFANTINNPSLFELSRPGLPNNFTGDSPLRDDSTISGRILSQSQEYNEINHILDAGNIIFMASTGESTLADLSSGKTVPQIKQSSLIGSSKLQPLVADSTVLFVQNKGGIIRNLNFDYQVDGYRGDDLTIYSSHLFEGHTIVAWAYQKVPHSLVYAVRDDGVLLIMTYVRDQNVLGWTKSSTNGSFKNVACISEGKKDVIYVVVEREIDGVKKQLVERLDDFKGPIYTDGSIIINEKTYSTVPETIILSGGTTWGIGESITATASGALFTSYDVGKRIRFKGGLNRVFEVGVTSVSSETVATVSPIVPIPVSSRSSALKNWEFAVNVINGLWNFEGVNVSITADSDVIANPNNLNYDTYSPENGSITLPYYANKIIVGHPYTVDIETLDIDNPQGESIINRRKTIAYINLHVENTRAFWAGPESISETVGGSSNYLSEAKIRSDEDFGEPTNAITDTIVKNIDARSAKHGRVFIRQSDPLPITILAITRSVKVT